LDCKGKKTIENKGIQAEERSTKKVDSLA